MIRKALDLPQSSLTDLCKIIGQMIIKIMTTTATDELTTTRDFVQILLSKFKILYLNNLGLVVKPVELLYYYMYANTPTNIRFLQNPLLLKS